LSLSLGNKDEHEKVESNDLLQGNLVVQIAVTHIKQTNVDQNQRKLLVKAKLLVTN